MLINSSFSPFKQLLEEIWSSCFGSLALHSQVTHVSPQCPPYYWAFSLGGASFKCPYLLVHTFIRGNCKHLESGCYNLPNDMAQPLWFLLSMGGRWFRRLYPHLDHLGSFMCGTSSLGYQSAAFFFLGVAYTPHGDVHNNCKNFVLLSTHMEENKYLNPKKM